MNEDLNISRYNRQVKLKGFGPDAQARLMRARILVIGAGGLGCPALQYLAAAGAGTIGIADDDVVSLTDLNRQVLYRVSDIGRPKVEAAAENLRLLNNEISIIPYEIHLTTKSAWDLIHDYDVVIDGTDNFSTRYLINDASVLLNTPLVYGAISGFEGQLAVFNVRCQGMAVATNYRDLFCDPPADGEVQNCAEAGVLGVVPGLIGTLQASEAIKLVTGVGEPLAGKLLICNLLDHSSYILSIAVNEEAQAHIPCNKEQFLKMNYERLCSPAQEDELEVSDDLFQEWLTGNKGMAVIDIREEAEQPGVTEFAHLRIPFTRLMKDYSEIKGDPVILFCQSGARSLQAAKMLKGIFHESKKIYSLKNGILAWKAKYSVPVTKNDIVSERR